MSFDVEAPGAEVPQLQLAPFHPPPLVSFFEVLLGNKAIRTLLVSNPKSIPAQIHIQKLPDVNIELSWTEMTVNPNESVVLELSWYPEKVLSQRTSIQITEKPKGKYDIIILLKSIAKTKKLVKKGARQSKIRRSPLKLPKPKSPKQKSVYAAGIRESVIELKSTSTFRDFQIPTQLKSNTRVSQFKTNEFELSPKFNSITEFSQYTSEEIIYYHHLDLKNSNDTRRDTYLINSNVKSNKENILNNITTPVKKNKNNKESRGNPGDEISVLSAIENLEFTPIKSYNSNYPFLKNNLSSVNDGLKNNIPKRKFIVEQEHPDYSIFEIENIPVRDVNTKSNNITHPVINLLDNTNISSISILDESKKVLTSNKNVMNETQKLDEKHCNRTNILSPKIFITNCIDDSLFRTPNNLFNNSIEYFNPHRCSTEVKTTCLSPSLESVNDEYIDGFANVNVNLNCDTTPNSTFKRLSSETYTKGDSPIIPIDPDDNEYLHSSPYSAERSPLTSIVDFNNKQNNLGVYPLNDNMKNYNERAVFRNNIRDKNNYSSAKSVIEANLWQKSPPRPISPTPLFSIPEEPSMTFFDKTTEIHNKTPFETFILNKTFDKINTVPKPVVSNGWKKTAVIRGDVRVKSSVCTMKITHSENSESELSNGVETFRMNQHIDVYSAAATVNPFIESAVAYLYDEKSIMKLEAEFKKWLNYLLTPPSDLDSKLDVDIGKTWIENRCKAVPVAPTREQVSSKYHTNHRLESLRKSANVLISTTSLSQVFLKVSNQVEKKILSIRTDKSLHVDIGLQKTILNILLCYNPLWLRIGLEAIHGKTINLSSNDDVCGLSEFIIDNVFRIPNITAKHLLIHPSQIDTIKKNTLKKVFFLIYFLDQAKEKKIIFHDPCLFCRNAPFKESKQILFQFTKELLSGVGDITKHLRPTGYVVSHKQTYLNEFKYAVHNLAVDLKDGIRLTRLMEIILMKEQLTLGLRTPAISRLQKVHNVQIALTALANADFTIVGDISAKDIADGHREKTLSLLWQLINKFRAPLFIKSAVLIQKWWRRNYLAIWIRNNIAKKKILKLNIAAMTIQSWWRGMKCRRDVLMKKEIETNASIVIQKYWRMSSDKRRYLQLRSSAIIIQNCFREYLTIRRAKNALIELRRNHAAETIQKWFKQCRQLNGLRSDNKDHEYYIVLRASVIKMQCIYRAKLLMRRDRDDFIAMKSNIIKIQRFYRSAILSKNLHNQFLELKSAAITIQNRFRANKEMIRCRNEFTTKYNAIVSIQRFYRNYVIAKNTRNRHLNLLSKTVFIQRLYRATLMMRIERKKYAEMRKSAVLIQRRFRDHYNLCRINAANKIIMWYRRIKTRRELALKNEDHAYFCQLKYTTVRIQQIFRAKLAMEKQRHEYITLKTSVIKIQKFYRSVLITRIVRREYLALSSATLFIQNQYRANKLMQHYRNEFITKQRAAKTIQNYYRNHQLTENIKNDYLKLRSTVIFVQRYYRTKLIVKQRVEEFRILKSSAIIIQRYFREYIHAKKTKASIIIQRWYRKIKTNDVFERTNVDREHYLKLKAAASHLQATYRANVLMRREQTQYNKIRFSIIKIQQYYRSIVITRTIRQQYLTLRYTTIILQKRIRANNSMAICRNDYLKARNAAIVVQKYFRNYLITQQIRNNYLQLKAASICVQTLYRAKLSMKMERDVYLRKLHSVILIQRYFRAHVDNKKTMAAIKIQKYFRNYLITQQIRNNYLRLKAASICVQTLYRAKLSMKMERDIYLRKLHSVILIQRYFREHVNNKKTMAAIKIQKYFRNYLITQQIRNNYLQLKTTSIFIQTLYRAKLSMIIERDVYLRKLHSIILIQRYFRAHVNNKKTMAAIKIQIWYRKLLLKRDFELNNADRDEFLKLRSTVKYIQALYRANVAMKNERNNYIELKSSAIMIQRFYRNYVLSKTIRNRYLQLKMAAIFIQNKFRANRNVKYCREEFVTCKSAAITIQRYFRNYITMKTIRREYLELRSTTIFVQRIYRSKLSMYTERNAYGQKRNAVIRIQNAYRAYCDMKLARNEYVKKRNAAIVIQNSYKSYYQMKQYSKLRLACITIQRCYRTVLNNRKIRLEIEHDKSLKIESALKIQAYWRGYNLRKKQKDDSKIKLLRQRWQKGGLESQQLTLVERNNDAIYVLSSFKDIASVIRAFKTLDFVSSVYPIMYSIDGTAGRIARNLMLYMGSTNRSVSALETLHLGASILINLTRYNRTAHNVYNVIDVSTILHLMMRWCDKDSTLLCSFSTLLWLFGKYDDIKMDLAQYLNKADQHKILSNIRKLILRKKKINIHKRNSIPIRMSMTPAKSKATSINSLPFTEPDYGITRSERPKIFQDELEAIDHVYMMYNIPSFD